MKTTTILLAYLRTRDMRYGIRKRNSRQYDTFEDALLRRIEACDRAREILRIFADDQNWDFDSCGLVNWDLGEVIDGQWQSFNPAQIAREALGR